MEREIAFDTETTGLDPKDGHKLVELGAVEMVNRVATGKHYHIYINPERPMSQGAFEVHGLSDDFLRDKPTFSEVANEFLEFVGDARLVIHNADFDMKFINSELKSIGKDSIPSRQVFCTLKEARKKFPGSPASLDALCKRFEIDTSARTLHGALLDAELLAEMYMELMGGRQDGLALDSYSAKTESSDNSQNFKITKKSDSKELKPREFKPTDEELKSHSQFLKQLNNPLWNKEAK